MSFIISLFIDSSHSHCGFQSLSGPDVMLFFVYGLMIGLIHIDASKILEGAKNFPQRHIMHASIMQGNFLNNSHLPLKK